MNKLIKITLGIALAFLVVGCESSEAKSSGNSTQTQQVEQQTTAQTRQMTEEQKYKILATGALEHIQNAPFKDYQNTTFKQMLEKWTNMCASVAWDIVRVTAIDSKKNSGNFMVTAYCEIKDFEATKAYLQSYYTQKGYVDFSFNNMGRMKPNNAFQLEAIKEFLGGSVLYPLIPSGEQLIEKMNESQRRKVFDYIMDKIYMPLSQAINESTKIYIAYPFYVKGSCEYDDLGNAKCVYNARSQITELLAGGYDHFLTLYYDWLIELRGFHIALEVGGKKLFVISNREPYERKIDMQELMFFNKSIDTATFMEKTIIPRMYKKTWRGKSKARNVSDLPKGYSYFCDDEEKDTQACDLMISTPAIKKILYDKQEHEQFFKDFAAEIIKIYSESN